jgi:hypothetical protein
VHDQLTGGRRFRILNVVDDVTRECLEAIPDTSISGQRVALELTALPSYAFGRVMALSSLLWLCGNESLMSALRLPTSSQAAPGKTGSARAS